MIDFHDYVIFNLKIYISENKLILINNLLKLFKLLLFGNFNLIFFFFILCYYNCINIIKIQKDILFLKNFKILLYFYIIIFYI